MTSLKKLTAVLAVSLPLAAAAQAPAAPAAPAKPLYQLYGTLNVNFQVEEAYGATTKAQNIPYRFGVSVDSSNIGVRGTADVSHGLGVVYQCETSAQIDGVGILGLCGRNSRLGVSSAWGTLFYGNWDSPYKAAWYGTKADDAFGNTDVFDAAAILSSPGFNTKSTAGQTAAAPAALGAANNPPLTFAVRAANSVAYHSPKFGGLSAKLQYSANEFADQRAVRAPELYSAVVNYDMGPLSVFAAFEDHEDWLTGNSRDQAWKVGAGYELALGFGTTTIGGVYEQLAYRTHGGTAVSIGGVNVNEYKRPAWMVNLKHRMGDHEFRARYSMADPADVQVGTTEGTANGTGGKMYALGYAYYLSKAAQVYAFWTQIENDRNAQYTFATAGIAAPGPSGNTPAGADPWSAGLGMRYAF